MSTHRHLTVRKASAGSGKTYQLAYNFIRLILGRRDKASGRWHLNSPGSTNSHRHILAITFTNKATDEMKRRIVRELAILAKAPLMQGRRSGYAADLISDFGLADSPSLLVDAARKALRELLFDYAEFNVSTIDAFFQSVLRSFAYEADLSGNYEVSLDSDSMVESGISEVIDMAMNRHEPEARRLKQWLEDFMTGEYRKGNSFNMLNSEGATRTGLRRFIKSLTDESYFHNYTAIREFLQSGHGEVNPVLRLQMQLEEKRREILAEAMADAAEVLNAHESILEGRSIKKFVEKAASGAISPTASVREKIATPEGCFKPKAPVKPAAVQETIARIAGAGSRVATIDLLLKHTNRFGVFEAVTRSIDTIKADANTILLSDTNSLLRRIIGNDTAPFLYERTGMRLRHFLIDEFQDTSRLQWQNLKPLVTESLAHDNDNLIIGDVKQCIYRFRNSDPRLLGHELENDSDFSGRVNSIQQSTNYRSAAHIVEFNNRIFPQLGIATGHPTVYPPESDPVRSDAPEGYVDVAALPPDDFREQALERMFAHICRQLDPAGGNYRPADIAVLTRKNDGAAMVVNYLTEHLALTPGLSHVKVISDESLQLSASPAVRRVMADVARLSHTPIPSSQQADSHNTVTQSQFDWIASEFDRRRLSDADTDPYTALNELLEEFNAMTPEATAPQQQPPLPLPLLVADTIGRLPEEMRRTDSVYLYALLDLVDDFCQAGSPSLHDFMEWWQLKGRTQCITSAPSADAIVVMTIHKAKGLEYDCVHIPFVDENLGREDSIRWYDCGEGADNFFRQIGIPEPVPRFFPIQSSKKDVADPDTYFKAEYEALLQESRLDDLNVLYVAFTRPVRELIVSLKGYAATDSGNGPNPTSPDEMLRAALGCTRTDTGEWQYTSGMPTSRIIKTSGESSPLDEPTPTAMPPIIPPRHPMVSVIAEIASEPELY